MPEDQKNTRLIVVGSSAGGIEALSRLVATLPEGLDAPVVIAQHLDPERESRLPEILGRRSSLPVRTVVGHDHLKPGVVYVIPSNRHVNVTPSEIDLRVNTKDRPKPSVDMLMGSAAEVFGEGLIAVVLTGTGSDGAEGARAVRQAGGTVIIQDPRTAEFGGMPGSLAPNTVDIVADLERVGPIVGELLGGLPVEEEAAEQASLRLFLEGLKERHGVDFTSCKTPTILRRLKRRMVATDASTIDDYALYLEDNPRELPQLVNTLLIKVTQFFRNPELFAHLREDILPGLAQEARQKNRQLRVWSAGCATGEEAYSLAIMLSEILGSEAALADVRIFATDIDAEAVDFARRGVYPAGALSGVSEEQKERYFIEGDGHYEVKKPVRGMIVFGEHDLARRSPFPRIDLVMSRNVLIYFTPELQRRALELFAFSLRNGGYLVLGKAETASTLPEFFTPPHRERKVYRRDGERLLMPNTSPVPTPMARRPRIAPGGFTAGGRPTERRPRAVDESLINQLPVGLVVVDRRYDIQDLNAAARNLLSIRGAAVGEDLLHAVQDIPYAEVRDAIDSAFRDGVSTTGEFSVEEATGEPRYLKLACHPQRGKDNKGLAETVAVVVNDVTDIGRERRELQERLEASEAERKRLETQNGRLIESNRRLEEANGELTALNDEMQASYEDALLAAEEAQSATEEVETLNEELQATNEERWRALIDKGSDVITISDPGGTVRFASPSIEAVCGYKVEEFVGFNPFELGYIHPDDIDRCGKALRELADHPGRSVTLEHRYRHKTQGWRWLEGSFTGLFHDPAIGGLVANFRDITERKRVEEALRENDEWLRLAQSYAGSGTWEWDLRTDEIRWSGEHRELFGFELSDEPIAREHWWAAVHPEDLPRIEESGRRCLEEDDEWPEIEYRIFREGEVRWIAARGRTERDGAGRAVRILGISVDATERKEAEEERDRLLAREWVAGAEAAERERISRELHDRVAHSMGVVHQSLQLHEVLAGKDPDRAEAKLDLAREMIKASLESTRNLSAELRRLDAEEGLEAELRHLLDASVPPGIRACIRVDGDEAGVPGHVRGQLFLVLREAVRNAVSHSGCGSLSVKLDIEPERVVGSVEDDGRGFDDTGGGEGVGLRSMRERAALLDGALRLECEPDRGTRVEVSVPLAGGR